MLDDGGHEPPGSVEQIVMSRDMVAKRRSKLEVCHWNSGEQGCQLQVGVGSRDEMLEGGRGSRRGDCGRHYDDPSQAIAQLLQAISDQQCRLQGMMG